MQQLPLDIRNSPSIIFVATSKYFSKPS